MAPGLSPSSPRSLYLTVASCEKQDSTLQLLSNQIRVFFLAIFENLAFMQHFKQLHMDRIREAGLFFKSSLLPGPHLGKLYAP